jgi:hypothetical protein
VRKLIPYDLMSGYVFIFMNKRWDKIKLLMWASEVFAIGTRNWRRVILIAWKWVIIPLWN